MPARSTKTQARFEVGSRIDSLCAPPHAAVVAVASAQTTQMPAKIDRQAVVASGVLARYDAVSSWGNVRN